MKQNYLFLIIFLTVSHSLFSMEQEKKEQHQRKLQTLSTYLNSAETFELMENTDKALNLYNQIISTNLPESPELTSLKQKANERIDFLTEIKPKLDEAQKFINQQNYLGALDKINTIPVKFRTHQKVIEMKNFIEEKIKAIEEKTGFRPKQPQEKLEREQLEAERLRKEQERKRTELERLQQQQKLQDDFILAEQLELIEDTDSALSLYTQIINTNLPESPELITLKKKTKKKIDFLTEVKLILEEAQELIKQQNYLRALDKINTIPAELRTHQKVTNIKIGIEKKIEELKSKQPTRDQHKKEQEKLEREQFEAEQRKLEEQKRLEQLKQEQLTNKSLQQLLQTLIQLTSKLKFLADYITSHAPL